MGEAAKKAVVFELTNEKILDAGDKVAAKHLTQVQKIVQKNIEAVENEVKDERARELENLKMETGRIRADAEMANGSSALPVGRSDLCFFEPIVPHA